MGVVNLGSVKSAPKFHTVSGTIIWGSTEVAKPAKINTSFVFRKDRTYLVFVRSNKGDVMIGEERVSVNAINVMTNNVAKGIALSGGQVFTEFYMNLAFGVTIPEEGNDGFGVYLVRPVSTDAASLFYLGIYEL